MLKITEPPALVKCNHCNGNKVILIPPTFGVRGSNDLQVSTGQPQPCPSCKGTGKLDEITAREVYIKRLQGKL